MVHDAPGLLPERRRLLAGCCRLGALALMPRLAFAGSSPVLDVPYVPTPQPVVDRMLQMAAVKANDLVMDVGCGDGRMLVSAARDYKAHGIGVDINPERIAEARRNAMRAGVSGRVEFRIGNLFEADLSPADVLAMYLLERINLQLRPKILATTRPGTRIVSHAFSMGDWKPDQRDMVNGQNIYLWIVPAKVDGRWEVRQGQDSFRLDIRQTYQEFNGRATLNGSPLPVRDGRIRGNEISFAIVTGPGQTRTFRGRVNGKVIEALSGGGSAYLAKQDES